MDAQAAALKEATARRMAMNTSSWPVAANGARDFRPVSQMPLDGTYQRSKFEINANESMMERFQHDPVVRAGPDPASIFIAQKYVGKPVQSSLPEWAGTDGSSRIVFGSDPQELRPLNVSYGESLRTPPEKIDMHKTIVPIRDATLDGEHPASTKEEHFLNINNPFESSNFKAAASYRSALMLRENNRRHTRSAFHPDQKFNVPPTEMNEYGWKIEDKYDQVCAKHCEGAPWHGRQGSHITKFSERLLLGARHHVSGPAVKKPLHY